MVTPMTTTSSGSSTTTSPTITVKGLYRHAIKGLSADELDSVTFQAMESFPDDRRFALLRNDKELFDPSNPEWIHKSNFLCAFSAPKLMAKYQSRYSLKLPSDTTTATATKSGGIAIENEKASYSLAMPNDELVIANSIDSSSTVTTTTTTTTARRLLTLSERETNKILLDSLDLATEEGRNKLAEFFSNISGEDLSCVTADKKFQFGNTSSGIKAKGNSRTVHLINAATVREFSNAIGIKLNPTRFRPNIVIDGLEPWEEFNWVRKNSIRFGGGGGSNNNIDKSNTDNIPCMDVIQRTVRCDGISVDPLVYPNDVLDIPKLLVKHFPQHGPYLGVYCHIEEGGTIALGDSVHVQPSTS